MEGHLQHLTARATHPAAHQKGDNRKPFAAGVPFLCPLRPIQRWYAWPQQTVGGGERACRRCASYTKGHTPGRV